jgi:hypothetical protein
MSGLIESSADARSKIIGQNFRCRAWVSFNGTSTVAVNDSGNVTDITDHGTGDYSVNFTSPMPHANYSTTQMCGNDSDTATSHTMIFGANSARATTSVRIRGLNVASSGSTQDQSIINIAIFC